MNKNLRKLFLSYSISTLGDWFTTIALLGVVYNVTQSGGMISVTLISKALPSLLLMPFAGVLIDRFSRKNILLLTQLFNGFLVLVFGLGFRFRGTTYMACFCGKYTDFRDKHFL